MDNIYNINVNIQDILKQKHWQSFNLKMTKSSFDTFTNKILDLNCH